MPTVVVSEPVPVFPVWRTTRFTPSDNLCFVLMPLLDPAIREIYDTIVEPQIRGHKLTAKTADDCGEHVNRVGGAWTRAVDAIDVYNDAASNAYVT